MSGIDVNIAEQPISVTIDGEPVDVSVSNDPIDVSVSTSVVEVSIANGIGPQGPQGEPGAGFPTGGAEGQVLAKVSSDDYDTEWVTVKKAFTHTQSVPSAVWTVTHNLGYKPGGVIVEDSAGTEWVGEIDYVDNNTLTITFQGAFSGTAQLS